MDRRTLIQSAAIGAATLGTASGGFQANEKVGVAVMGAGRGSNLASWFARLNDSQVVAIAETDLARGKALAAKVATWQGKEPRVVDDFRRILEASDIDAFAVATPDHWHGPATVMACVAGKDVYVEKPCSHNVREGRIMINAARKHKRIVQVGTQLRAAPHYKEAWKRIQRGDIGKVMMVKAINNQRRPPLPHHKDEAVPNGVNYDVWMGPAQERPFNRNRFHYGWHWLWDYGTGDIGNDGVHQIDIGRWAMDLKAPKAVSCSAAKLGWRDGAQETPDTMVVTWEYDDLLYVFEQRDFTPYRMLGHTNDNDNIIYGDKGFMMIDRDGFRIFHERGKVGESFHKKWSDTPSHYQNFLDCVNSRNHENLNADIEEGHYSAMLCHLGNIAYRVGRRLEFDGEKETFVNDAKANELLTRQYRKGFELPKI